MSAPALYAAEQAGRIRACLHDQLLQSHRYAGYETGGVLGLRGGEIVCSYRDTDARAASDSYMPSPRVIDAIIRFHNEEGCDEICFIHSHPSGHRELSYADCHFAQEFLRLNPRYSRIGMMLAVDGALLLYRLSPSRQEPTAVPLKII